MKPIGFTVKLGPAGPESVVVDGHDVSKAVSGVQITGQDGGAPIIRLQLVAGVDLDEITAAGVVIAEPAGQDVARWLANIDAAELERAVLDGMSNSPMSSRGSPVTAALALLRTWAEGRA